MSDHRNPDIAFVLRMAEQRADTAQVLRLIGIKVATKAMLPAPKA